MSRPGDGLRVLAAHVVNARTMERVVDPAIADLQRDSSMSSYVAVVKVLLLCISQEAMMFSAGWTSDDRRAVARVVAATALVTVLGTLLFEAPPFLSYAWRSSDFDRRLPLYLAPQAFPLAVAIGVTLGTVFGIGGRAFSGRVTTWVVALGIVVSVIAFIDLAWITPAANQAFRVAVSGNRDIVRGVPEMTLGELWQMASPDAAFAFHTRWALAFSPFVLIVFAWSIVKATARSMTVGLAAVGALFGYYMLLYGGRSLTLDGRVPALATAWLPNVVLVAIAVALMILNRRLQPRRIPAAS
jgi:hypothetical protein